MRFGLPGALFAFIFSNTAAVEKIYCLVHPPLGASDVPPFRFDDLRPFAVNRIDPLYTSKVRGWLPSWSRTKAELIKQLGSWDSSRLSPKDIVLYKQVLVTIPHTTTGPQVDLTDAQTKSLYDDF
ncbi:hypothetical protein SAMD00023353_6300520 [Rosellinia necatrix]|uniref:Uncharacterized protein n=1 Tax=Rosellinia necatrix TaxID=77044 RepID=A0A1S8AAS1_ROSNE|nr:hypothetical protein SAMD00023353_6300520 [Rosellinia necatrix]